MSETRGSRQSDLMSQPLDETALGDDPVAAFHTWFDDAKKRGVGMPEAMALATVSPRGMPAVRFVLCRGADERGLFFFTNQKSAKAADIDASGYASAVFYWDQADRQVRVSGSAHRVPRDEAAAYFATRPRGSRLSSWASPQSEVVATRAELEGRWDEANLRFPEGTEVPMPEFCGGYRITWEVVEFWQRGDNRLHDRFRFRREGGAWKRERLAP